MAAVSGTTKNFSGAYVPRLVRVYRKDTGAFVGETVSNPTTGVWSITVPTTSTKYFAVQHDGDADEYWTSVKLLIDCNDTALTDFKGRSVSLNGNVARSAVQSRWGGYSAALDGSGDWLGIGSSSDFDASSGDFTFEISVYVGTTTQYYAISHRPGNGWLLVLKGGSAVSWNQWTSGGTYDSATGPVLVQNAWNDLAVSRIGNSLLVLNGGIAGSPLVTANRPSNAIGNFEIGRDPSNPGQAFAGYFDAIRWTSAGRYAGDYTVTGPFYNPSKDGTGNALIYDDLVAV